MTQLSLLSRQPPEQLPLALRADPAPTRDEAIEGPECEAALRLVDAWPHWPSHAALLFGPSGSGKSFTAALWAGHASASRIAGSELSELNPQRYGGRAVLIEHVDIALRGERPRATQTGLFHLLNTLRESGGHVLMTSRTPLEGLALSVRDLTSRLKAAAHVQLHAPGSAHMEAVLFKLFADRQLALDLAALSLIRERIPRSLSVARQVVDRVDRLALAEQRRVTRAMVMRALRAV